MSVTTQHLCYVTHQYNTQVITARALEVLLHTGESV